MTRAELRPRDPATVGAYLALNPDGTVTIFSGKVELGTGVATALAQIVAGELGLAVEHTTVVMGDTDLTPDQGTTAGSKTLQTAGPTLQRAAMAMREALLNHAAERLEVAPVDLTIADGVIRPRDGSPAQVPLAELASVSLDIPLSPPGRVPTGDLIGQSVARMDVRAKLTGAAAYVHDIRLPGMLHGRVIRPYRRTGQGAGRIRSVDDSRVRDMPGVTVVRKGDFLAVVSPSEWQAITAADRIRVDYEPDPPLPSHRAQHDAMRHAATHDTEPAHRGDVDAALQLATRTLTATYRFPVQAHGSMGPSCAVADVRADHATIYTSTQGVYGLRQAIAPLLALPETQVRLIYREGAGCYGHNGADDVAADAAVLSQLVDQPVRVQWMRRDEFAWEPKSPGMLIDMTAAVDADGSITGWQHTAWTATHTARPGGEPARLLVAREVQPDLPPAPLRFGGGDRNAATTYTFPNERVTMHWLADAPLHTSAMRSLGGLHNTTANECFFDEVAQSLGEDPVQLRLRYLDDPRAVAVVEAVAERANWGEPVEAPAGWLAGRGFAYARYEGDYAYVALIADVLVDAASSQLRVSRVVVAHDCGQIINPDGVRNQIEGNIIQGISRSLYEDVHWDDEAVTTLTWETYRILTYPDVPEIDIVLLDRPTEPPWGAGEPAICPVTAAIGNAIAAATGVRQYQVPYLPGRVRP